MIFLIIFFICFDNTLISQEYPQDFFEYHLQKYNYDIGKNWDYNSTLEPFSYKGL